MVFCRGETMKLASIRFALFSALSCAAAFGQTPPSDQEGARLDTSGPTPVYRVTVVARSTKAINYRHRSGPTNIAFTGTALMPAARGDAHVNSKQGRIEIKVHVEKLTPSAQFGPEYLTYVLWAVTPEGRPKNLGEVLLSGGGSSNMEVTTDLQTFGLIVTAEPYFAVTHPSDVVVMENIVTNETSGTIEPIDVHYELLQRGQYVLNVPQAEVQVFPPDRKVPLELYEARNAVRIAKWTGADRYDQETLHKAEISLENAEEELHGKVGKKTVAQNSRDAAQMAEDARLIAVRRIEEERLANERAAAAAREEAARSQASQAETERAAAERAKAEAETAKSRAESAKAEAESAAERANREKSDAEAARAAALTQQQAAESDAERARQTAEQAEQEKAQLREQLRQQLNTILETRETARGLIVNMSDVLFDFGKYTLKPGAREKLAKIAGIIISHPGLKLQVEGHTDSVGSDDLNQRLSEQRANAVREYLVGQSVTDDSITARGFGKTRPVASNDAAGGRQLNRRVELVVSGDVIGTTLQKDSGH
jgi:outer membrane protein OmpA-like peptidoglycan-associated protein